MNKRLIELLILTTFLGFSNLVLASVHTDLAACSKIQKNSDRLGCYDTVANYYKSSTNNAPPKALSKVKSNHIEGAQEAQIKSKSPEKSSKPVVSSEDRFGQPNKDGIESIHSNIVGSFTGWKKGLKLTLQNGQVWKVTNSKNAYKKMENPKITITRGMFNSYDAKVEGLNARAKVKRIK